jgi:hypothetical protein
MKASPYFMTYGEEARLPSEAVSIKFDDSLENLELIYRQRNIAVNKLKRSREHLIEELNRRAEERYAENEETYTERNLRPGDRVLRQFEGRPSKLHPKWDGPFIIKDADPHGTFTLMTSNGHVLKAKVNGCRLKKFKGTSDEFYYASAMLHKRDKASQRRNCRRS